MPQSLRIKRRPADSLNGNPGPPDSLFNAELAFNEISGVLYYGAGTGPGNLAADIIEIGGPGAFMNLTANQAIFGVKEFYGDVVFAGSSTAVTKETTDNSTAIATTAFVKAQNYATLVGGVVPSGQLPSYVDDVVEYADIASLPEQGESGKIYVTLDSGRVYRWSGSAYIEIVASPGSTDEIAEGVTNLFLTQQRVYDFSPVKSVAGKTGSVSLTKSDVGLGDIDNTSDADKPVSVATQAALDIKADVGHTHFVTDVTELSDTLQGLAADIANCITTADGIDGNAVRIALKRSSTENYVPTASALVFGELFVNYSDGRVFIKKIDSAVLDITEPLYSIDGGRLIGTSTELAGLLTEAGEPLYTENFRRIVI